MGVGLTSVRRLRWDRSWPLTGPGRVCLFRRAHPLPTQQSAFARPGQARPDRRFGHPRSQVDEERDGHGRDRSWKKKDWTQGLGLRLHGRTEGERGAVISFGPWVQGDREYSVKGEG